MIKREIEELFSPRILGARWIEDNALSPEEAFTAYTIRTSLESIRDELLERVRREQFRKTDSNAARKARKQARRQVQQRFRFASKAAA